MATPVTADSDSPQRDPPPHTHTNTKQGVSATDSHGSILAWLGAVQSLLGCPDVPQIDGNVYCKR